MRLLDPFLEAAFDEQLSLDDARVAIERRYMEYVLARHDQNKTHAARFLKVHRNTFDRRAAMVGLNVTGLKWKRRV